MPPSAAPAIRTGARCVRADRDDVWRLAVIDRGHRQVVTARSLANATGAWTASVAETILRLPVPAADAVQICQIVVRRLFETENVYVFQNSDGRLIFASPYERDFTLIGTVDHAFTGDPAIVAMPCQRRRLSVRGGQPLFPRALELVRCGQDRVRRQHAGRRRRPRRLRGDSTVAAARRR